MRTSNRRIALLAGASITAIGTAMPANAAVFPGPGAPAGTVVAGPTVSNTLTICATDNANAAIDCQYGVIVTGAGAQVALVTDPASGQILQTGTAAAGAGSLTIVNNGDTEIRAEAISTGNDGSATIEYAIYQDIDATGGNATALIDNNSLLQIVALGRSGTAAAPVADADARADIIWGIGQYSSATGAGFSASSTITNDPDAFTDADGIVLTARSEAFGTDTADSYSRIAGVEQYADAADGTATVSYSGTAPITVDLDSLATALDASADALTYIWYQDASTGAGASVSTATTSFANNGTVRVTADVTATGTNDADARIDANSILDQYATSADGNANALVDVNAGWDVDYRVTATTSGTTPTSGATAYLSSFGYEGIMQNAFAGADDTAIAEINNDSTLDFDMRTVATGRGLSDVTLDAANAYTAYILADQTASTTGGTGTGTTRFINNGSTLLNTSATATATLGAVPGATNATAESNALGVLQSAEDLAVFDNVLNATTARVFRVTSTATASATAATGASDAEAIANAGGVAQQLTARGATARFDNDGTFTVTATAAQTAQAGAAGTGSATAEAVGYGVEGEAAILDFENDTAMTVTATAGTTDTSDTAEALAIGVDVEADTADAAFVAAITGTIINDGTLTVTADAADLAEAKGVYLASTSNTSTLTNTGSIIVDAISGQTTGTSGGTATAWGIEVDSTAGGAAAAAGATFTIANSGDIRVRESNDNGATWNRGFAIYTEDAPNAVAINLTGGADGIANIYGNLEIDTTDTVTVSAGETRLNGEINNCTATADLVAASGCTEGTLAITGTGTLLLQNPQITGPANTYDGPSYAFVDTFTQAAGGVIAFDLQPLVGGTQPIGSYSQVIADSATLNGTLEARITTENGLFEDIYTFQNVIDAVTRVGDYEGAGECVIGGTYAGSVLLNLDCVPETGNIDLVLTRTAFDDVPGLNVNALAAAGGLECLYEDALGLPAGTPIVDLLADLFLITDEGDFNIALNQLAGTSYANYLASFSSLGVHYNDLLDKATACEVPALAGSVIECRASAPLHVWGELDYQRRRVDGDALVDGTGDYRSSRVTGLIGIDGSIANAAIVGVSAGYVRNKTRDYLFGDSIESDGFQLGLYGVYDPGPFYVKALGTHSWFNGRSERILNFGPFGATTAGLVEGDPDVTLLTLGLHGGARFPMGGASVVTPYLNLDHVRANMKQFTETGLAGPALTIDGSHRNTYLTAGVKWAGQFGGLVPEVNLGYRHRFGDRSADFLAAFNGDEDCVFEVTSASEKRGSFLAGLSVGGKLGRADIRLGYEGEFNSDVKSHSGNLRIVFPIGGRAAPVVAAPPPPPPPPPPAPVEAAPPPPPPPPPPAPSGERGR